MIFTHQAILFKNVRLSVGYTQEQMGKFLGVSKAHISNVERAGIGLSVNHWKKLKNVVSKDEAMQAMVLDYIAGLEKEYANTGS